MFRKARSRWARIARLGSRQPRALKSAGAYSEPLESRVLLTSTLYLDYGDNWPGGVLNTTVGAIDNTTNGSNPNIDGPRLTDSSGNNYGDAVTVAITSLATLNPVNGAAIRAAMTALTTRFYEPFDINVVELVGTAGAANLNDVSTILGLNEGSGENNDTYLLIGGYLINGTDNPNSNAFGTNAYGGLSTGTDINGDNNNDGTALVIMGGTGNATFDGPQNAHEAGHAFGLEHVYRQNTSQPAPAGFGAAYDMLHQSELMSYLGYNSQGGFNFFSRFPVMDGDGNTDQNTLADAPTPYDDLVDDPNIGPSGIEYVTGSGANDIITITKTGATTANVSLQAFTDAAYSSAIDFPGATGTTYTYTINIDRPLTIDAGGRNDRIIIDGDLGNTITLRGMHGTDELIVKGKGAGSAVYTTGTNTANGLDGNSDLRGVVQVGTTIINFQEFESASKVTIEDVDTLTVRTGGGADTITDNAPGTIEGTSTGPSGATTIVPLTYSGVAHLIIDAATNDGATAVDSVTLDAAPIAGLLTIVVNTGAGADTLTLDFNPSNPVPGGGLSFDGGTADAGEDLLVLRDGTFATEVHTATGASSGTIALSGGTNITYSNLSPIDDSLTVTDMTFNAMGGADQIAVEDGSISGFTAGRIRSANGTFEQLDFANKTNVTINAGGGGDTVDVAATARPDGLASLTINGGDDADTVNVTRTVSPVAYTVNGNGGDDRVNVAGAGLAAGSTIAVNGDDDDDTFDVTSSADVAIAVDGGGGDDTLKLNGEILTYAFTTAGGKTTFSTGGRQDVTSVGVELLDVRNGTFTAVNTVEPNVRVQGVEDGPATLDGTGTIAGTLTADSGGTVSPAVGAGVSGILGAGSTTLNAGSTFAVDLSGLVPGVEHDQLNVTGTVTINGADLAGTLNYTSIPGEELVIIRNDGADAVVGKFAQGDMIEIGGRKFAIDYAFDGDGDGNLNDVALIRYGAELAPDPCDPSKTALYVSATTGDDKVLALPVTGSSRVRIVIEAVSQGFTDEFGPFDFDGQIIMMGQSGNDLVSTEAVPSRAVMLYGNAGNDRVVGGNNGGILLGNIGDDELVGGNGRDVLIGGSGADTLRGQNAGDILVAGATSYDTNSVANRQALCEVLHTWEHGGRRSALLNAGSVIGDSDVDVLAGGLGVDWFVKDAGDSTDETKSEVASVL